MLARLVRLALVLEIAAWSALSAHLSAGAGWGVLTAVLAVPAGLVGVRLAIVCTSFALAHAARGPRTRDEQLGPVGTVRLVAGEWRAMLVNNFLGLPFENRVLRPDPPLAPDARVPILLVHGYLSNRGTLAALARALEAAGAGPVFVRSAPHVLAPVEAFAAHHARELDAVTKATGQPRAILVCHSMGGLAARAHLARHGPARVAALVTLGSPHHGSVLARVAAGANAAQMRPGSDFLTRLAESERQRGPGCAAVSVYSVHDNLVAPQDSSRLPWARNVAIHGVGHLAMLADRRVHGVVLEAIAAAAGGGAGA